MSPAGFSSLFLLSPRIPARLRIDITPFQFVEHLTQVFLPRLRPDGVGDPAFIVVLLIGQLESIGIIKLFRVQCVVDVVW
jgi:hypothetical protein